MVGGSGRRSATREYRSRHRLWAQVRVLLGGGSLGLALVSAACLLPTAAHAQQTVRAVAVDRQDYVSDTGPDAYQASAAAEGGVSSGGSLEPDPVDIHVAAAATTMTYHSLLHVELPSTSPGWSVGSISVTLFPTTNPQRAPVENINPGQVILDAYPLKTELPIKFDPNNPPAADMSDTPVVGKINNANGSWSFDLTRFAPYWALHGNTGLAVQPNYSAATQPWSIGFDRTLSVASVAYTPPSVSTTTTATSSDQLVPAPLIGGPSDASSSGGGAVALRPALGSSPAPAAAATPALAGASTPGPAPAPVAAATVPPVVPPTPGTSGMPIWLVVLLLSLVAAVALLAQPVTQVLSSTSGVLGGALVQWRRHPRMIAVACGLLAWSSVFSVYANTTGKSSSSPVAGAVVPSNSASQTVGGSTTSSTPTPSAGAPGATPSAAASGGAGSSTGPVAGAAATHLPGAAGASSTNLYPNAPNPPSADLFSGADNTVGITSTTIQVCAHAALTFGPAFNIGASDLNVFWTTINNQGGIYGRKIVQPGGADGISFQDDGYQTSKAVTAAQACADQSGGTFFLLSGIGFDQIPAVRVWAEQNHMLYIHHIATQQGTAGLQYSFTMLPTLEQVGVSYGQYYLSRMSGSHIGIIYRQSSNWDPGRATFKQTLKDAGQDKNICDEEPVDNNQGDYTAPLVKMQQKGCDSVFIWENALAATNVIQQAHNQNWNPKWLLFPFNLTLKTLDQAGVDTSQMQGIVPWPSYTCKASGQPQYSAYRSEIQAFEAAYAKYDPGANLCGDGGDLLFGTWLGWKQVYDLLVQCGPNCTRNQVAGLLENGYHARVGANCSVDFRNTDGHHGGTDQEDVYKVEQINGAAAWATIGMCESTVR